MARPNGVVIVSERYWAFAGVDGSLREGAMPQPPELLQRVPLARGLVRLYASLAPLLKRDGVARRRERWLILTALIAPLGLALVGGPWSTVAGIALSVLLVATILRGRALHLHGAEHRAIAAAEARRLEATWEGQRAAVAVLAALRNELRCAGTARHVRRRSAAADRPGGVVACRRARLLARADDGALAARPALDRTPVARLLAARARAAAAHDA